MGFNIFDLLLPREVEFFIHMRNQVDNFCDACNAFKDMVSKLSVLSQDDLHQRVAAIKEYELRGDRIERYIINELDRTFITPLDREDIHSIVVSVDKSMDILNSIAQKIEVYKIRQVPLNVTKFSTILVDISLELKKLISGLKNKSDIDITLKKMHMLENEADYLFHNSIAELFEKYKAIEVIKLKDIYELLEDAVNSVDSIGKLTRGILVKQG